MAVFQSAQALASHQRQRARKVRRSLQIAAQSVAEEMKKEAARLVSGTVSEKELRALGHPFARRRTTTRRRGGQRGNLPRLSVNVQSGELRKSLRVFRRLSEQGVTFQLQFTSPHAVVLSPGGTSRMVARGFWTALRKHYDSKQRRKLLQAFRLANK